MESMLHEHEFKIVRASKYPRTVVSAGALEVVTVRRFVGACKSCGDHCSFEVQGA